MADQCLLHFCGYLSSTLRIAAEKLWYFDDNSKGAEGRFALPFPPLELLHKNPQNRAITLRVGKERAGVTMTFVRATSLSGDTVCNLAEQAYF